MTHWLRAVSALAEDLGLFFSTHSYNHQKLLLQGIGCPHLVSTQASFYVFT